MCMEGLRLGFGEHFGITIRPYLFSEARNTTSVEQNVPKCWTTYNVAV